MADSAQPDEDTGSTDLAQIDSMEANLFLGKLYTTEENQADLWYTKIKVKSQTVRFKLDMG